MSTNVVYLHNLPEKMRDIIKSNIGECIPFTRKLSRVYFKLKNHSNPIGTKLFHELRDMDIHVGMYSVSIIRKNESFKVVE